MLHTRVLHSYTASFASRSSDGNFAVAAASIKRYQSVHRAPYLCQKLIQSYRSPEVKASHIRSAATMVGAVNGAESEHKFLIYGKTGWIGGLLGKLCAEQGIAYEYGKGRLENREALEQDIATVKPTHVFNAAGVTGRPNVDWCESHKVETIRANVVGTLTLADVCKQHNLVLINYATGCIFEYDSKHPLGSGIGFKEEDTPNFHGSYYSKTKAMVSVNFSTVLLLHFEYKCHPSVNICRTNTSVRQSW